MLFRSLYHRAPGPGRFAPGWALPLSLPSSKVHSANLVGTIIMVLCSKSLERGLPYLGFFATLIFKVASNKTCRPATNMLLRIARAHWSRGTGGYNIIQFKLQH